MKQQRQRLLIAFFDYPDVFEDFYPHYGVDREAFSHRWSNTGNHAFLSMLQRQVGDAIWYVFSLAPELTEVRHEVVGCRIKMLPSSWLHRHLWRAFYLPKAAWRWRWAYPAYATVASYLSLASLPFLRMLWRDRPDFFFLQDYATGKFDILLLVSKWLDVPLIAYHSGSRPEGYLGRLARRWTIRQADWLIASSQDELEMLARRYRVPRERLKVVLTPIDTTTFRALARTEAKQLAGLDSERRYLLFVGRLDDPVKRVSALIRSFASLAAEFPDADLLIAGEGPDDEKLQHLATETVPARVHFLGWIAGSDAKVRLYNAAECLLLPSRSEGFPTVVGEAMACGTPVLASRVGGVSELVVDGQTGWLFAAGDDRALTAGLAYVLAHPEAVASLRAQCRRVAEARVSPEAVAAALKPCFSIQERDCG
jgi:glycosyltransferase involved in cell wall biosynthesis